ncbi:TPA: hypothetical protein LA747_003462 [Clostridium botulinum]|nr:hypothetical protein [Clostridium botulinum]HBJ2607799.1 hypothetical protein [Clostridium botulinum]HDI3019152.1 hypothetical protein [Clostridium botulinum]
MDYFNKFDEDFTKELNNIDKMKAIESWQDSDLHPLTCRNCRKNLYEDIIEGEVVLKCTCGYIQDYVPKVIYEKYKRLMTEGNE